MESAEPDLKKSEVSVKGVFEAAKLVDYMRKRTGKQAVIVKQEPEEKKEKKEEKKGEEGEKAKEGEEKKEGESQGKGTETEESKVIELKKNEYYYYPQRYAMEMYAYPPAPQIFSDENPNACSVM